MEKKTPLYDTHVEYGGKIVPFAGYLLPVQYQGVIAEHNAVRNDAGLFDVSHMGEITCTGKDALANLNHLLTNDYTTMYDGQAYSKFETIIILLLSMQRIKIKILRG